MLNIQNMWIKPWIILAIVVVIFLNEDVVNIAHRNVLKANKRLRIVLILFLIACFLII